MSESDGQPPPRRTAIRKASSTINSSHPPSSMPSGPLDSKIGGLETKESIESFSTAKSLTSSMSSARRNLNADKSRALPPPPSPSSSSPWDTPFNSRHWPNRPLSSVDAGAHFSDDPTLIADRQTTPVPRNYASEQEQMRWDSEDQSRSLPRSSRLASPHRLHTLSTASTNSFSSSSGSFFGSRSPTSPTVRRDGTPLPPLPPMPPPNKPLPQPVRQVSRTRSASLLGMATTVAASRERDSKAAHRLLPQSSSPPPIVFTVLVVGSPQCGKSILISKGLKQCSLSREQHVSLGGSVDPSTGLTREIRAVSRTAHVSGRPAPQPMEVIEVSSTELLACGSNWPDVIAQGPGLAGTVTGNTCRPRLVDGLIVCYNTADSESWTIAKTLLGS